MYHDNIKERRRNTQHTETMSAQESDNANDALLGDDEKKRRLFWSVIWVIFTIFVALPLCSFLAPIWLVLQLFEAFLPVCTLNDEDEFLGLRCFCD